MLGKILSSPLKLAATRRKSSISAALQGFEFAFVAISLIQDGGRGKVGGQAKMPLYKFFPCNFYKHRN